MADGERITTRRAYTGRVISLDIDSVRYPDGSIGEQEMIRHPGASAVVPFLSDVQARDPQILLIKQYRYAANQFLYEIPAGRLDADESPEVCARRELLEETGYSAAQIQPLVDFFTTPGFTDEHIYAFVASGLTYKRTNREPDEFIEVEEHPLSAVLAMIERGKITDAKTALSLLFLARIRRLI
jgi:ADP-ribose diphosphatase